MKLVAFIFLVLSFSKVEAQELKVFRKLDSLKFIKSTGTDSTWFIRHEKLNENSEDVIIVGFKNLNICISNYFFDNYKIALQETFDGCIKNDSNKVQALTYLLDYKQQFKSKLSETEVGVIPPIRALLFESMNEKYERQTIDSDRIFINKLMRLVIFDQYDGRVYSEKTVKRKKKRRKPN